MIVECLGVQRRIWYYYRDSTWCFQYYIVAFQLRSDGRVKSWMCAACPSRVSHNARTTPVLVATADRIDGWPSLGNNGCGSRRLLVWIGCNRSHFQLGSQKVWKARVRLCSDMRTFAFAMEIMASGREREGSRHTAQGQTERHSNGHNNNGMEAFRLVKF